MELRKLRYVTLRYVTFRLEHGVSARMWRAKLFVLFRFYRLGFYYITFKKKYLSSNKTVW